MRVYIAGPITGHADFNREAFADAAKQLQAAGHDPVNPCRSYGRPWGSQTWEWYMRRAITLMLTCDAVAVLPGWERSRGATLEIRVARELGMRVAVLDQWTEDAA